MMKNLKYLFWGAFPLLNRVRKNFFTGIRKIVFGGFYRQCLVDEKRELLLENKIALWDVIASCEITGSSDSSIKEVSANDISIILDSANIKAIYVNGKTAEKYYNKYIKSKTGREAACLPSTSPANAAWNLERLIKVWGIIAEINGEMK